MSTTEELQTERDRRQRDAEVLRWAASQLPGISSNRNTCSSVNTANIRQKQRLVALAKAVERGDLEVRR